MTSAGKATVLALALAATAACGERSGTGVERVVLIGVDGLDGRVLERLIERERLPNLARFLERGLSGEAGTLAPAYSPVIWASVATGKLPGRHGITGFVTPAAGPGGARVPFTSNLRRTKALWNILGELGHRVAVVGWWTTWPAEPVNGVMVSDRMLYNRFNLWFGVERAGLDLPAQTYPPKLLEELSDLARSSEATEPEFFERFAAGQRPPMERDLHDPWFELLLAYARDRAYGEMLDRVLERESFDFVAYYLNGPDIASHYFWKYLFPEEWDEPLAPEEVERYGGVIETYYEFVDESIGPLLARADQRTVVILVSDHGFVTGRRPDSPAISGTHYLRAPPGVLALAGGGLPRGVRLREASVLDVAPTVLHLLGHPAARDMDGRTLAEVVSGAPRPTAPPVDSYETGGSRSGGDAVRTEYDEAILEKLRALGYIGSDD